MSLSLPRVDNTLETERGLSSSGGSRDLKSFRHFLHPPKNWSHFNYCDL